MLFSWLLTHGSLILGLVLGIFLVTYILLQKRSPSGTIAWLLAIIFLPYIGVPLYLMLGGRKMRRIAGRKQTIDLTRTKSIPLEHCNVLDRMLRSYGNPEAETGNSLELCTNGQQTYHCLIDQIESARQSIDIATYVFGRDDVGYEIIERLTRKAEQGVQVRLLLDGVGSLHIHKGFLRPLIRAGGQAAFFMPVLHHPLRGRTNLRNHRKIVISDNHRVLAGGTNIANEYLGRPTRKPCWQDLSFVLQGPAVRHYWKVFSSDWEFASGQALAYPESLEQKNSHSGRTITQVVPSGPDVPSDSLYDAIMSLSYEAQKRLWIVTPYFVPDDPLTHGLVLAVRRGVDVRIFIPNKSNHPVADVVRGYHLRQIQQAGGQIYRYMPTMLHAKTMLMDDQIAMIGSANYDIRSLYLNYELAILIYSQPEIQALREWIESLIPDTEIGIPQVNLAQNIFEGVLRMVAPLL